MRKCFKLRTTRKKYEKGDNLEYTVKVNVNKLFISYSNKTSTKIKRVPDIKKKTLSFAKLCSLLPRQQTLSTIALEVVSLNKSLLLIGAFTSCWYYTSSKNAVATQQLVKFYSQHILSSESESELSSGTRREGTGVDIGSKMDSGIFLPHHALHFAMMTSLTAMQLIVGLGMATLFSSPHSALGILSSSSTSKSRAIDQSPERNIVPKFIGLLHYFGTLFTNLGFAYGSASIVQVIKLLEPIETLLLTMIVHKLLLKYKKSAAGKNEGPNIGIMKVVSVFAVVAGASLLLTSKGIKKNVNFHTVIFALFSGFALSSRNVAQKAATRKGKDTSVTNIDSSKYMNTGSELKEAIACGLQKFISITSYAIIPSLVLLVFVEMQGVEGIDGSVVMWLLTSTDNYGIQGIVFHGLYNIASMSILGLVSAPTHSLLNVGKRISNVLVAAMFFSEPLGAHGTFGLSIAAIGGCIYSKANSLNNNLSSRTCSKFTSSQRKMAYAGIAAIVVASSQVHILITISSLFLPQSPSQISIDNRRRKKIVLLGAHERYNFGDLLFSKVLDKLLRCRAGYNPEDILIGSTIPRDMSSYGGWHNILSMKTIQQMSRKDTVYGPYDIVYTGGEALGCTFECAKSMLPTPELKRLAEQEKIYDCPYLVPKEYLLPTYIPEGDEQIRNYAVVNSMGGHIHQSCQTPVNTADFLLYRDRDPLNPDSAVMTKELFHDEIDDTAKDVLKELFPDDQIRGTQKKYIAVQHSKHQLPGKTKELAEMLDAVSIETGAIIVFFAAGIAEGHDSFPLYHEVSLFMKEPNIVYEVENVWKVVALISRAEAVLGTSLHVRIMSFIYFKPRITWCDDHKYRKFISLWDTSDSAQCIHVNETWPVLMKYFGPDPEITQNMTTYTYADMVEKYLQSFDIWSSVLIQSAVREFKV